MRHSYLDHHSRIDSPVHRLSIAVKLVTTIALLLSTITLPPSFYIGFATVFIFLLLVAFFSTIPAMFLLKRILALEVFVISISLLSLLQTNGIFIFATLMMKSTLSLFAIILFSNTTPFSELLAALRKWSVPSLLITLLALMYRYLFVLVDELERMQRARTSRTFVKRRLFLWRLLATVISQLFIRSLDRAERIFAAMCARGWQ